jgi:ABC-type Na+ efflux pump permease subunit
MAWFSRSEIAEKLSAAEAENETLRADLLAAQGGNQQLSAVTQELAEVKEDLESCKASLTEEQAAHKATKDELAATSAKLAPAAIAETIKAATASEEVESQPIRDAVEAHVTTAMAACGIPPLNIVQAEQEDAAKSKLSREAFNALSPRQKSDFCASGGQITA